MRTRSFLKLGLTAIASPWSLLAAAQPAFADRPIRIVVPYPPGGFNDTLARVIGPRLSNAFKTPVIIDNKPGGNTLIGNLAVAQAPADGHTLLVTPLPFSVLPALYGAKLPYDSLKAFAPVIWACYSQNVMVVRKGFPASSVAQLVQHARRNPGKVNYASSGAGSSTHLAAELFKNLTKTDMVHIPYKGSAPAVTAILAGEADVLFDNVPNVLQHIKANAMQAFGVTARQRATLLPDVPTLHEAGVPDYEMVVWFGFQAPGNTPGPVVAALNAELGRALRDPAVVRDFGAQGVEVVASSAERFADLIRSEIDRWGRLVKDAGINLDS